MLFQISWRYFPRLANPPNVAHHTAAVALVVRENNDDRESADPMASASRMIWSRDGYEGAHGSFTEHGVIHDERPVVDRSNRTST